MGGGLRRRRLRRPPHHDHYHDDEDYDEYTNSNYDYDAYCTSRVATAANLHTRCRATKMHHPWQVPKAKTWATIWTIFGQHIEPIWGSKLEPVLGSKLNQFWAQHGWVEGQFAWTSFEPQLGGGISILAWVSPLPAEQSYRNRRTDDRGTTIFIRSGSAKPSES